MERSASENIFIKILPVYMEFLENQKYYISKNKGIRINLYDCFYLDLIWKKCWKKYLLSTTLYTSENYTPTQEDRNILKEVSDLVSYRNNIAKICNWYREQSEKERSRK
jgi:hypothetical protein